MTSRRLLVTGGAGFIGCNFLRHWIKTHPDDRLVVLDALTYAGNLASLPDLQTRSNGRFVQGNIGDRALVDSLLKTEAIDTLVHFAAESHVDRSILGPAAFIQTNIVGTFTLLEAFREHWQQQGRPDHYRWLQISTDEVYGSLGPADPPFSETTAYAPNSPYAASKAGSDHLVRACHQTYGLPTLITHCSNNYGPYQYPEKLIPLMCINGLLGRSLPVYGDGQNIRDWIHVADHCRALEAALEKGIPGESYNLGGNNQIKNIDLVRQLCTYLDDRAPDLPRRPAHSLIRYVSDRPGHDRRYAISTAKAARELGWQPAIKFEHGLRHTVSWYLNHKHWWQPLLSAAYRAYYRQVYGEDGAAET
ncbi:dTDP-glucose 4,6-dehydratase [filamentous cyanobacterium CCP5]|nr:dTDP-glucose 4,6-dehydratase [filamentous cyanobacterium CCP5]